MDGAYIALNRYNHLKTIETRSEKRMNRFKMIFEVIEVLCCLLSLFSFLISLLSFEFEVIFTLFILCLEWPNLFRNAKKNFYYYEKFHISGGGGQNPKCEKFNTFFLSILKTSLNCHCHHCCNHHHHIWFLSNKNLSSFENLSDQNLKPLNCEVSE